MTAVAVSTSRTKAPQRRRAGRPRSGPPRDPVIQDLLDYIEATHPVNRHRRRYSGGRLLATELGISPQAVYQWKRVPVEYLYDIEQLTSGVIPRERLRPDLYRR